MVGLLQKQEILPASLAAPSFVCVDVVVRSTTFLSDLYAQLMDQFVVHVVERIFGEKSVVHQSLTKSNKRQVVVVKGIARQASLPDQLYFHTLSINQVTKDDTQAFLEVEVESDQCMKPLLCKVDTGAEGNVISLSTYKSLFPDSPCNDNGIPTNLSSSSTIISAFGGHPVDHCGTCVLKLAYQGSCKPYHCHVVDVYGPTILALPICTDLNLVILNVWYYNSKRGFEAKRRAPAYLWHCTPNYL